MISHKILVLGAANIDLIAYPKDQLIYKDANIGTMETIFGGVGRNIAENLVRLGFDTYFLSVFAQDEFAKQLIASCNDLQLQTTGSLFLENAKSATFMAIMDEQNDLALGISAMDIYDTVPLSLIDTNKALIDSATYCVLDTNMPEKILQHITQQFPNKKFALDAVSGVKALKAKTILKRLHILKVNLLEAELLSSIQANDDNYKPLLAYFIAQGVQNIFITLGNKGVVYADANGYYAKAAKVVQATNTSGAGDAFMAGLVYGTNHNFDIHKTVSFAQSCAALTVQHKYTVHPELNTQQLLKNI